MTINRVKHHLHIVSQPCLASRVSRLANGLARPTYAVRPALLELKSAS